MKACVLKKTGDAENLIIDDIPEPSNVGENELLISHYALGVNYDDVLYRNGTYEIPDNFKKPYILGFEGVGEVIRKGNNIKSFNIGDKVGYAFSPLGAYTQKRVIDYRYVFSVPKEIPNDILAGSLRKGLLVESLLFKVVSLSVDDTILVHSVAGGVGHLLVKWAKSLGLKVIGTIGDVDKMSIALASGCDLVINRDKDDIYDKVAEFTDRKGVKVVYDGIGKPVFEVSRYCLKPFGVYVSYGYSGGKPDPVDIFRLRENCLFFTAPVLEMYKGNRYELLCSVSVLMDQLKKGIITPQITRYGIEGIRQAHIDLESKKTIGSLIVNIY